jgi:hypothetical protein
MRTTDFNRRGVEWLKKTGPIAAVGVAAASANMACFAEDAVVSTPAVGQPTNTAAQEPTICDDVDAEETTGWLIRHRKHHYTQVDTKQENADDLHAQQGLTDMSSMTGMRSPIQKN